MSNDRFKGEKVKGLKVGARFTFYLFTFALFHAAPVAAQNTRVNGTFKTQDQLTPSAAGLKVLATIGATPVYGRVTFRSVDTGRNNAPREITCGGITHPPQNVPGWIKGDGTLMGGDEVAGVLLIPTEGCTPTGLAYEAEIFFNADASQRRPSFSMKQYKPIPAQASVDWSSLASATASASTVNYQTQLAGGVLNYESWTRFAAASVPNASSGVDNVFIDPADNNLKAKDAAGAVRNLGSAGSGDITRVGDCLTGDCYDSVLANLIYAGPASGAAAQATMRLLVPNDIPTLAQSKITNLTTDLAAKLPLAGGTMTGTFVAGAGAAGAGTAPFKFQAGALNTIAEAHAFEWDGTDLFATNAAAVRKRLIYADGSITGNAGTASALAANGGNCAANQFAQGVDAAGVAEGCAQINFSQLAGALAIGQVPNDLITYAKIQNVSATSRFLGRITAGAGDIEELNPANAATLLAEQLASTQLSDFATKTGSGVEVLGCTTTSLAANDVFMWDGTKCVNGALSSEFSDSLFRVVDNLDATKKLAFEVAGFPTATTRTVTPFNGASVIPEPRTCAGTDKVSAITAAGAVTCSADEVGAGGGDAITVNTTAVVDPDFIDTATIDVVPDTVATPDTVAWNVIDDSISNAKLRNSAATSVIGRSAGTTGDPADIAASLDGQVLRRASGTLGFGAVDLADADAVTGLLPDANIAATLTRDSEWPGATATLTNKTLDVEGTGNVVTTVSKVWLEAAGCQNTTASLLWDTPTTNPAVAACVTGTNTQKGVADFADAANLSMQRTLLLPSDFTGAIDAKFKWFTTATTGDVVWQLATICVADGETDDPAFNTASTVTDTAKGTANQTNDASIASVTITGCAAGELLHLKLSRDSAHASDTLAATARLIGLELTLRRAQ